ncbi:MAG: hypothetical protein IKN79_03295 [Eubacterium sp.]|nr:hypothetical protein [Eubacterium sp.]
MLVKGSDFVNYQAYHIQNALQEKGLGPVGVGGSTGLSYALTYDGRMDYKSVVEENKKIAQMGPATALDYVMQFSFALMEGEEGVHDPSFKETLKRVVKDGKNRMLDDYSITEEEHPELKIGK